MNSALNKESALSLKRLEICRDCKLWKDDKVFGEVCNSKLYLNPKTNDISITKIKGYIKGCGCLLELKTRVPKATCIIKKW
jgi:hypothetical protein